MIKKMILQYEQKERFENRINFTQNLIILMGRISGHRVHFLKLYP